MSQQQAKTPLQACYGYLSRLRNARKRQYGFAYVAWLRNGKVGVDPERLTALSYMGAQAVRMAVAEFKLDAAELANTTPDQEATR